MTEIDIKCDLSVIKQGNQLFIMAETACMIYVFIIGHQICESLSNEKFGA